jgi:hypothetical protein
LEAETGNWRPKPEVGDQKRKLEATKTRQTDFARSPSNFNSERPRGDKLDNFKAINIQRD